ncbi:cytochrome c [Rouxiella silvae]|uniref:Cytochrome c n=1 Tax=Rouxiella silvae TaxID=1646373 RepID=A0AA40X538_9GAMM|nr:cytochrome c [Rouxiella silvae]MBF6638649.1 cytochrome c [Rouxiella silvae]
MKKITAPLFFALASSVLSYAAFADTGNNSALIKQGEYVARTGDCMACHTVGNAKPYSGGLGIKSPFGIIYSTNISPDPKFGIGNYTEQQFADAVRKGVRKDGSYLYPAMPYPSYAKMTDQDIHALYVYFMHGVQPAAEQPKQTDLSFPFNQRWGIMFWDKLFTRDGAFTPTANRSDEINRGAYLVQAAGHCGSCHTPRAISMQEKAYDDGSDQFLAGTELNGWNVPSLRAGGDGSKGIDGWSVQEIVDYLQTGRNQHAAVGGEMTAVIQHSTSHMTDADVKAIAEYLKTLPQKYSANESKSFSEDARTKTENQLTQATDLTAGQRVYLDNCAACHFVTGKGASGVFPPLAGNALASAENPTGLVSIILNGSRLPTTPKAPTQLAMPDFGWRLTDAQVANLATFIRSGWGNSQAAVSASEVKKIRAQLRAPDVTSKPMDLDGVKHYSAQKPQ